MATAPGTTQPLTMPSPKKVVSKSLTVTRASGLDLGASLMAIQLAAQASIALLATVGIDDPDWLRQINDEAERRWRLLDESHTDREVTGNGNRASGG